MFFRLFDPDMSPLGFELDEIYLFATRRIQIQDIEQQQVKVNHREAKQCVEPIFFVVVNLGCFLPSHVLFSSFVQYEGRG